MVSEGPVNDVIGFRYDSPSGDREALLVWDNYFESEGLKAPLLIGPGERALGPLKVECIEPRRPQYLRLKTLLKCGPLVVSRRTNSDDPDSTTRLFQEHAVQREIGHDSFSRVRVQRSQYSLGVRVKACSQFRD